jgi:hypothetical protein
MSSRTPKKQGRRPKRNSARDVKPRQIRSNIIVSHRFRYTSTSGNPVTITQTNLLSACGVVGLVVNSTVNCIASTVRLREIEIWTPPAAQGSAATCSAQFSTSTGAESIEEVSDTTVSTAVPAHIKFRPSRTCIASFWDSPATGNTTPVLILTAPAGSIVDCLLDFILTDTFATPNVIGVVTDVVGTLYWLALDGPVSNQLIPTSLRTTL